MIDQVLTPLLAEVGERWQRGELGVVQERMVSASVARTVGAMLATSMGVRGGAMQIAAHALGKMTLFMCAGAVYVAHHKTLVSELNGLGRVMPWTFGAFFP